jgi:uncharacterized ferritin-like protein (DUF455 family)
MQEAHPIRIHDLAAACLHSAEIADKLAVTHEAWRLYRQGALDWTGAEPPAPIGQTRFPSRPEPVEPRHLPKRSLTSVEGRIALLHAVAHIEFTAIHLAWDILYRFRDLPDEFRADWLGVAAEEAEHFEMIRARLRELGADYGDLPVHRGLWSLAVDTADDVLARLALVPRCMEARGLDVTPGMIDGLERHGDAASAALLRRILHDEIGHVVLGSRWFAHVCRERGLEAETTYFDLLGRYLRSPPRGPFNRELRTAAGFSASELKRLERGDVNAGAE